MTQDMEISTFQASLKTLERGIAELSNSDTDPQNYFRTFTEKIVSVLGTGGAAWMITDSGELLFTAHINLSAAGLEQGGSQEQVLRYAISRVLETQEPVVLPARQGSNIHDGGLGSVAANHSDHALLFIPIVDRRQLRGLFLLIAPPDIDTRAIRGFLDYISGLCGWAGYYLQGQRNKKLEIQLSRTDRIRQYISALHCSLQPSRVCYALANYGQELLGVFRCMAGTYSSKGKFRLESVSGLESVAVKSNFIKSIAEIAAHVCRNDKVLLVDNPEAAKQAGQESDDLITAARLYMLQAGTVVMGIFPIRWEQYVVGALIVEKAKEEPIDAEQRRQIEFLSAEAGSALHNSLLYRDLPFSPLVRAAGLLRDKVYRISWMRRIIWAALIAGLLMAPFLFHKQVKVIGTAELVPTEARIAYAQQDGVIQSVAESLTAMPPHRAVQKGEVLAALDMSQIDNEIDRVTNAIMEVTYSLDDARNRNQMTMAAVLESRLKVLEAERDKYLLERRQYEIVSPVDGTVITRESEIRHYYSRPVARGEAMFEIVPEGSSWHLKVNVPENAAGELLRAYDHLEEDARLRARVILNAYPDTKFETYVISVARKANVVTTGEQKYRNVIEVRVAQPEGLEKMVIPRQGMEGKVAIECGERTLFYALTHEFVNFVRVSLF